MHESKGGLGFKSLSAFNYAMLGKQAWSLMMNLGKLITRLLKLNIFPSVIFLIQVLVIKAYLVGKRLVYGLLCKSI
jgi:hypothetical protein